MSDNPQRILDALHNAVALKAPCVVTYDEAAWLLAQLKHRDDQIAALRKLATVPPRQATLIGPAPGEAARIASFWEPMLGLPPGAIPDGKVALCLEAVDLSRRCSALEVSQ